MHARRAGGGARRQGAHSALLLVACFGAGGLARLAAAHVRVSGAGAEDAGSASGAPARGALAWRRVALNDGPAPAGARAVTEIAGRSGAAQGADTAGPDPAAAGGAAPSAGRLPALAAAGAVLLGKLYRDAPLGAAAQWRALVAASSQPALGALSGPTLAPANAGGRPAGALPAAGPPPASLAALASDHAAARELLQRLQPEQAAAAAAAAESGGDGAAGAAGGAGEAGSETQAPNPGVWRLRGEGQLLAGEALPDVAEQLQRNACYLGPHRAHAAYCMHAAVQEWRTPARARTTDLRHARRA